MLATFYKKNAYSKAGSKTIPKNVRMTDKTLLLYDSWQVLHTVVNVVRFRKEIFFSIPASKVLNATSPPFPSLSRNIILWSLSCSEQIFRSANLVSSLLTTLQSWWKIEMELLWKQMFEHQLKVYGNQFKCLEIQIRGTISQSKLSKSPWISHFSLKLKQKRSFPSVNMKWYINKSFLFFWASGLLCTQDLCESIVWRYRCFYRREKKAENCDLVSLGQKYISSDSLRKCSRRPKNHVVDKKKKVKKETSAWQ